MTTIKVSTTTRDALRELARRDGLSMEAELVALVRRARRRAMGLEMSAGGALEATDRVVIETGCVDVTSVGRWHREG